MSVKHHDRCATQNASEPENTCDCQPNSSFAAPDGSANLGEFTKASGQVRQCRLLWKTRRGLLKVQYVERGQTLVCYIAPDEFRPDSPNAELSDSRPL